MTDKRVNQPTPWPTRKVTAGAIGGAAAALLAGVLARAAGIELSAEEYGAVVLLCTVAASYMTKERAK